MIDATTNRGFTPDLTRPPEKLIERFLACDAGSDTIRTYLTKAWSLVICCRECPRLTLWTPPELLERFGDRPELRIADLVPRLSCSGEEGCGSRSVAVFPHAYGEPWTWSPPDGS